MNYDELSSVIDLSLNAIVILRILWIIFKIIVGIAIIYIACKINKILDILRDLHYYQRNHFETEFEVEEDDEKETIITKVFKKLSE
ncbi:hypothetical protein [Ruminococcus sp. Marseille-P6503]|uniref:hypothetical protein n=1 Tax=Ruminococcus sp. Marseille-P6503 TaxID=2364796 RepID=UPI000F51D05B|nr:hypothetical protein [Ruminococcus sp. Marseille-P6503]